MLLTAVHIGVIRGTGSGQAGQHHLNGENTLKELDLHLIRSGPVQRGDLFRGEVGRTQHLVIFGLLFEHEIHRQLKGTCIFTAADKGDIVDLHSANLHDDRFELQFNALHIQQMIKGELIDFASLEIRGRKGERQISRRGFAVGELLVERT